MNCCLETSEKKHVIIIDLEYKLFVCWDVLFMIFIFYVTVSIERNAFLLLDEVGMIILEHIFKNKMLQIQMIE